MSTEVIARYLSKITDQEASERPYILHYDHAIRDLRPWQWPISDSGGRLLPSQLIDYNAPGFLRPCCLCSVPVDGVAQGYIESIVAIAHDGERSGEYLLKCASETCAYEVYIERAYSMVGMLVKRYGAPSLVSTSDRQTRSMARFLEGHAVPRYSKGIRWNDRELLSIYRCTNLNRRRVGTGTIRIRTPRAMATPFSKLLRLDSYSGPGLPEREFRGLFTKCRSCEWIMTHKAFSLHVCPGRMEPNVVIDLTLE